MTWRLRPLLPTPHGELQLLQGPQGPTTQPTAVGQGGGAEEREKRGKKSLNSVKDKGEKLQTGKWDPPVAHPPTQQHCVPLPEAFILVLLHRAELGPR